MRRRPRPRDRQIEALERTGSFQPASARKDPRHRHLVPGQRCSSCWPSSRTSSRGEGRVLLLGTHLGLFVVHVGLYVWARVAPLAAAVVSLVLFLTLHLANAALEPSSIYKGAIVKVLFIVVLVKAIQAGYGHPPPAQRAVMRRRSARRGCGVCAAALRPGARFCGRCGAEQTPDGAAGAGRGRGPRAHPRDRRPLRARGLVVAARRLLRAASSPAWC
ncbi:MAG: hypothetical protein HS111_17660 [Kofleriaceae bacterium]|nr:hypothetical protein [Kofleriaceae bacterium]